MSSSNNIDFSFEFAVSTIVTIVVASILIKKNPNMSTLVVVLGGLAVAYVTLQIVNFLFPQINQLANNVWQYFAYQLMTNFNNMGYLHVWPPIFAVLIIIVVLLYNRNLG